MRARRLIPMLIVASCAGQPGPPPPPHPKPPDRDPHAIERRIAEIGRRLEGSAVAGREEKELSEFARRYLGEAARALAGGDTDKARRFADAADACRRPIDHLQHIRSRDAGPPPPPPGDPLRQVYFRLRLAEVFLTQIPAPEPRRLLDLAREFYEHATREEEQGDQFKAAEYARAADDLTHALESLAQAYAGDAREGTKP